MSANPNSQAISVTLETTSSSEDISVIQQGLSNYNLQFVSADGCQPLNIFLRTTEGLIIGGLLGETYWGWLHFDYFWIDDSHRSQGYGQRLLKMAEDEAIRRGCHFAHLDTMSFQALSFYQKHGYVPFGILEDLPIGQSRIFLYKRLV
jgi:GNAT superfamily N-acetyltransferase